MKTTFVNLTEIVNNHNTNAGSNKELKKFWETQSTKDFMAALAQSEGCQVSDLKQAKRGNNGGTFVHEKIVEPCVLWLNRKTSSPEKEITKQIAKEVANPRFEVPTPAGDIDILSDSEIIEVKDIKQWKAAIGQVNVYAYYYPKHQKRIHLFGEHHPDYELLICKHCRRFKITVSFANISSPKSKKPNQKGKIKRYERNK